MNLMSKVIVLAGLLLASASHAELNKISLRCTAENTQECAQRAGLALVKMSCEPVGVSCSLQREVDGNGNPTGEAIYCGSQSAKCSEAKPYLFGGVYCNGNEAKASLAKYDTKLTLSYFTGITRSWVRTLCVAR